MRVLLALLLVGIAGCGGGSSPPGEGAVPTPEESQAKTDKPPAQTANADPVAALEKIGAKIKRKEQGEVVGVHLYGTRHGRGVGASEGAGQSAGAQPHGKFSRNGKPETRKSPFPHRGVGKQEWQK